MTEVTLAATQMRCTWELDENIAKAESLVRNAAADGAQIILLQELFETPYFCIEEDSEFFRLATTPDANRALQHFGALAAELGVVLPISFFEKANTTSYNSLCVLDADGSVKSHYRKSHIPQSPGYQEKFYFSNGNTGFDVVETRFGRIGCGICWDQWFPETARILALKGAELLLFPTAIGSEPSDPALDSAGHWRRVMQGHAGANILPLVASNRVGRETVGTTECEFYGTSFIADHTGAVVAEADREEETHLVATFDLAAIDHYRRSWGVFRDRRTDLYGALATMDGAAPVGPGT